LRDRVSADDVVVGRLQRALDAGGDSVELREQYNAAVAEKRSAEAAFSQLSREEMLNRDEAGGHV
jgi:hypothetical protein